MSSVPAVKRTLIEGLRGALDVEVHYGMPGFAADQECVFVGGTLDDDQEWASFGALRRDERYALELVVVATSSTASDFQATTERAFEVFADIEGWLRANPIPKESGTALANWHEIAGPGLVEQPLTVEDARTKAVRVVGRRSFVVSAVRVNARI